MPRSSSPLSSNAEEGTNGALELQKLLSELSQNPEREQVASEIEGDFGVIYIPDANSLARQFYSQYTETTPYVSGIHHHPPVLLRIKFLMWLMVQYVTRSS